MIFWAGPPIIVLSPFVALLPSYTIPPPAPHLPQAPHCFLPSPSSLVSFNVGATTLPLLATPHCHPLPPQSPQVGCLLLLFALIEVVHCHHQMMSSPPYPLSPVVCLCPPTCSYYPLPFCFLPLSPSLSPLCYCC